MALGCSFLKKTDCTNACQAPPPLKPRPKINEPAAAVESKPGPAVPAWGPRNTANNKASEKAEKDVPSAAKRPAAENPVSSPAVRKITDIIVL